jgi:hypothetical protein
VAPLRPVTDDHEARRSSLSAQARGRQQQVLAALVGHQPADEGDEPTLFPARSRPNGLDIDADVVHRHEMGREPAREQLDPEECRHGDDPGGRADQPVAPLEVEAVAVATGGELAIPSSCVMPVERNHQRPSQAAHGRQHLHSIPTEMSMYENGVERSEMSHEARGETPSLPGISAERADWPSLSPDDGPCFWEEVARHPA